MSLPEFSIKRPVTTVMIYAAICLFGMISLGKLPQELFPPITYPQLTVVTSYENAAPEEIETLITKPVEETIGTVSGLRRLRSVSKEGLSLVIAEFGWSQNMDFAALRMREKIDLIKERLPRESKEPLVMKYNPFEMPIITLSITGERSPQAIREISRRIIKDELEKIEGVASATITGGLEREIIVEVNHGRLKAQGVPLLSVAKAITDANLNYPAGTIKESFYEYLIRTLGEFEHVNEIGEIAVKTEKEDIREDAEKKEKEISKGKNLVLLKEVGTVCDTVKERTSFSRYNGTENVSITIQKQAQANTLQVVNRIKSALKVIRNEVPPDIKIKIVSDQSEFIKEAITGVKDAGIEGGFLAFLVLLFFLKDVKSSLIVTLSIPISIVITFVCMFAAGISINMMSMGGLALGVGMLVDAAIVVLENITRHREEGEDPKTSAINGTAEVSIAIWASVLTTVVVFLPMAFVVGIAGQIFKELAFTITFSLMASLFVSLTIIPLLVSGGKSKKISEAFTGKESAMHKLLEVVLVKFLRVKKMGLFVIFCIFVASIFLFIPLDKELMPRVDLGQFIIKVNLPSGTRLEITDRVTKRIEDYILKIPEVEDIATIVGSTRGKDAKDVLQRLGSHQAEIRVKLKKKRKIKTDNIIQHIKNYIDTIDLEGASVDYLLQETIFSAAVEESSPIIIEIKGENMPALIKIAEKVRDKVREIKGIYGVKTDMPEPSPETKVYIDKDKASFYNLTVADIAQTSQIALKGYVASQLKEKGQEIDIRVRLREEDRNDFAKLSRIEIRSEDDNTVPLFAVARIGIGKGPSEIKRLDQARTIIISANIFKRPLKDVTSDILGLIKKMDIPEDFTVKLAGESEEMTESFNSLIFALIFSIILVYMIMAGEFESFWQPLLIMTAVPLSLIGISAALFITGTSINVVALLGVIMLGGIVVDNGIVLLDYLNQLRRKGMPPEEAVIEATKTRLRPILMTALTTILGLVPMAIAMGEGAELRSPMAITVIGGMTVTTFLTLIVIPAIYLWVEEIKAKFKKK